VFFGTAPSRFAQPSSQLPGKGIRKLMDDQKPKSPSASSSVASQNLRDLIAWVQHEPAKLLEIFPSLCFEDQMSLFILSSGDLRRELLMASTHADRLVAQLPVQEAYITLKEIGYADALPLLTYMTPEQIQYWTDIEIWEKEDFLPGTFLFFFQIMQQCGQEKLAQWLETIDPEPIVLAIISCGTVSKLDIFKDPVEEESDLPPYTTYDGYFRYHCMDEKAQPYIEEALRILSTRDPARYGMLLESAYRDVPSEVHEEALRFRNGRLSDRGIPTFDDALEIYRPLTDEAFRHLVKTVPTTRESRESFSALYPVRWLSPDSFLRNTLRRLGGRPEADAIRMELAALGNKLVVADGLEINNPQLVKAGLQKVAGYLTIGLESLAGRDEEKAADWIMKCWLIFLFRLGYSQVHRLAERAAPLFRNTRFRWAGHTLSFAGPPFEETLWALSRPRPLFFEGQSPENFLGFRDFQSLADVRVMEQRLEASAALFDFFSRRELTPDKVKLICLEGGLGDRLDMIQWPSILQTIRATEMLTGKEGFRLLLPGELPDFIQKAFTGEAGRGTRKIDPAYTDSLLRWVRSETRLSDPAVNRILEDWVRAGSRGLEEELGGLASGQVPDPRFIKSLCVRSLPSP
jgi:hypothetical protein